MNLASHSASSWAEPLGWTLVHFLWQGVLIAWAFAAARAMGGRSLSSDARYRLACVALAAMVLVPVVTFILMSNGSALQEGSAAVAGGLQAPGAPALLAEWRVAVPSLAGRVFPLLVSVWGCGSLAFSVRLAAGWAAARRMRSPRSTRPAPSEWQSRLERLMERMGLSRPVEFLVSSLAQTPVVIGYLSPVIVMPLSALSGLPVEQVESLLAHELAHIRRADYLVNLLQSVAEALLFYHPSVWWLSSEIRAERELCCDDIAVAMSGDAFIYARALAAVESARPRRLQAAMAANGGSLARRIGRLLDPTHAAQQARAGSGAAAALSILLVVAAAAAMNRPAAQLEPVDHEKPVLQTEPAPALPSIPRVEQNPAPRVSAPRNAVEKRTASEFEPEASVTARIASEGDLKSQDNAKIEPRRVFAFVPPAFPDEPVLDRIEFRGLTEAAARAIRERLPVREGRPIGRWMRERVENVAAEYGRRLEFSFFADSEGGVVLRIHPPGLANLEPLQLERRERGEQNQVNRDEPSTRDAGAQLMKERIANHEK